MLGRTGFPLPYLSSANCFLTWYSNSPNVSHFLITITYYWFLLLPVERQIAAIRAIRDVEIEHLLTELRLLRSHFNKEQLQTPVLQYFSENLPNLSVVRKGENRQIEVQWNSKERKILAIDSREVHASLLHQLSMAYSNCSAAIPSMDGLGFSSKTGASKFCFYDALNWN